MLHYQTLEPDSFKLLTELMANQTLKDAGFLLCGGTALALQMGHRMSTDLDIFTNKNVPVNKMVDFMQKTYGDRLEVLAISDTGFRGYLDGVKLDMIRFPFKMNHPPVEKDGLRLLDVRDGAAMKVHAIANRGLRRDYVDLSEILQKYPLDTVMESYKAQFNPSPQALQHTKLAMNYFGDAERTSNAIDIKNGRTWEQTKLIINKSMSNPRHIQTYKAPKPAVASNPHVPTSPKAITLKTARSKEQDRGPVAAKEPSLRETAKPAVKSRNKL